MVVYELVIFGFVVAICYFIYFTINIFIVIKKFKNIPGPEPTGILDFYIGDLKKFFDSFGNIKMISEVFYQEMRRFKSKTIKLRLFSNTLIVTYDPLLVKEIVIDQDFPKNPIFYGTMGFPGGERYMGKGLVTELNKDKWKHKRALLNPSFHKKVLKMFIKEFNTKGDILMNHLKNLAQNQKEPIRLLDKFNQTALDIIASVAFSINIDSINDPNNIFTKYINESFQGVLMYLIDPFIKFKPHKWPAIIRHRRLVRKLRDFGRQQIESRIQALKNGEELPNDILTTILRAHENEKFYVEDMVDDFVTFFVAGQETTSSALASAFLELGRNPEVLEKLKNEIDKEIGMKVEIEFDDLHKLKYTGCVFKETLRLYPPAPDIGRYFESDAKIGDLIIPKNTLMTISIYASGRNEDVYPEPFKFDPDRFMKHNHEKSQNYTYFPFSIGPRSCLGQNFAQIEAKVLMAKFIQNFDFKLNEKQSFEFIQDLTIRTKDGTKCHLSVRE